MKELRNYTCSAKHANCQAVFAKNRHSRRNVAYVAVTTLFKAFSGGSRNWWKKGRHRGCGAPHRGSEAVPRAEVQGHVVGCLGALTPKNTLEASRKALWWCKRQVHRWQPTVNFCTILARYMSSSIRLFVVCLWSVCLSVVCNVSAKCALLRRLKFSAMFYAIWYLGHPLTST